MEHTQKYKDAFEKIKKIAPSDSNLDKIVADFIKVESLRGESNPRGLSDQELALTTL